MTQLFGDVNWGDIEVAVVDMPPGTGDAQLSLSQLVSLSGALMVTTPQEVALADVRRAINMFRKVNVPVLGLVENMSGYVLPDGSKLNIFGEGGGESLSTQYEVPLLAQIPLDISLREGGDTGSPKALDLESPVGKMFSELAETVYNSIKKEAEAPKIQVNN